MTYGVFFPTESLSTCMQTISHCLGLFFNIQCSLDSNIMSIVKLVTLVLDALAKIITM